MTDSPASVNLFQGLSPEDETILMSLPYRIGLYVSYSDTTGGWEAQDKEQASLIAILRQYSEDFCKSDFAQSILLETLQRRSSWPAWSQNIQSVPEEAGRVISALMPLLQTKQLNGFRELMADIALSVAMAFHEGRQDDTDTVPAPHEGGLMRNVLGLLRSGTPSISGTLSHAHISKTERDALKRVCDAMGHKI